MDSPFESSDDNSVQEENSGEESGQEEVTNEQAEAESSGSEQHEKSSSDEESAGEQAPAQSESDEEGVANQASGGDSSEEEEEVAKTEGQEGSESDGEEQEDDKDDEAGKANLFGDADDISSSDEEKVENAPEETDPAETRALAFSDDEENDEGDAMKEQVEEEPEQQETRIEVEIPRINTDLGRAIHFVRFPNFVSVETRPFDPAVYEDEIEDDELMDEEGRTRMKLKVENTIRWKKYTDENGIDLTESNARLVKWSDGSLSMHLGSEIFDVHAMPLQGDHNHLFIRQGTGLQGQAVFKTKLTFRPHSTKSATHRKMTSRLAMRLNQSQQKVRILPIAGQDPESRKADLMKEEEDQLRAHMRREAQKRRMREKAHAKGLHANYLDDRLDDEDDSGAISVSAIKNRFKPGGFVGAGRGIYTSDSDSGDEKQLTNAKRLESDDSDDDKKNKDKSDEGERKKKKYFSDSDSEEETAATNSGDVPMESQEHTSNSD